MAAMPAMMSPIGLANMAMPSRRNAVVAARSAQSKPLPISPATMSTHFPKLSRNGPATLRAIQPTLPRIISSLPRPEPNKVMVLKAQIMAVPKALNPPMAMTAPRKTNERLMPKPPKVTSRIPPPSTVRPSHLTNS